MGPQIAKKTKKNTQQITNLQVASKFDNSANLWIYVSRNLFANLPTLTLVKLTFLVFLDFEQHNF